MTKQTVFTLVTAAILAGCATGTDIVLQKSTVFGLDITTNEKGIPHVRLGLVRNFYQRLPTSTNGEVFAPAYATSMDANMKLTTQGAAENYSVGTATQNHTNVTAWTLSKPVAPQVSQR